jgi:predicted RNA-binding protein YlxR (DUF448 family)
LPEALRTCVGCRQVQPQALLLRFARLANGEVVNWRSGQGGRSAYVCIAVKCFEKATRQRSFERSLGRRGALSWDSKALLASCVDALVIEARFLYRSQQRAVERGEAIATFLAQYQSPARGLPQASGGRA